MFTFQHYTSMWGPMKTKQIKEFTDKGIKGYKAKSDRYDV